MNLSGFIKQKNVGKVLKLADVNTIDKFILNPE